MHILDELIVDDGYIYIRVSINPKTKTLSNAHLRIA